MDFSTCRLPNPRALDYPFTFVAPFTRRARREDTVRALLTATNGSFLINLAVLTIRFG